MYIYKHDRDYNNQFYDCDYVANDKCYDNSGDYDNSYDYDDEYSGDDYISNYAD